MRLHSEFALLISMAPLRVRSWPKAALCYLFRQSALRGPFSIPGGPKHEDYPYHHAALGAGSKCGGSLRTRVIAPATRSRSQWRSMARSSALEIAPKERCSRRKSSKVETGTNQPLLRASRLSRKSTRGCTAPFDTNPHAK